MVDLRDKHGLVLTVWGERETDIKKISMPPICFFDLDLKRTSIFHIRLGNTATVVQAPTMNPHLKPWTTNLFHESAEKSGFSTTLLLRTMLIYPSKT